MNRLQLCLVVIGLLLMSVINAQQVDTELCPEGPIVGPDPNWRTIPPRFEIITELVLANEVLEISQAFSEQRDAIITNSQDGPIQLYWNFLTNEQFTLATAILNQQAVPVCIRQLIAPESQTSIFVPNKNYVKPSVLLGYNNRNQMNTLWGTRYDGEEFKRGIPAMRFKSCFYVNDIGATVAATYHVSNLTQFQAYLPGNESIILEMDVQIKNRNGVRESYRYNVFRYSPNPSRREERQALETPTGVFCKNRTPTFPLPTNIPDRVSGNSEAFIANFNSSIVSSHGLYDRDYSHTIFNVWLPDPRGGSNWDHYAEIHDFAIGLAYQYNYTTRRCMVRNISADSFDVSTVDGQPNLVQMASPQHFLSLDDIEYHYTGEKRCRDRVWCHVWIGEKSLPNNIIQHQELYWSSSMNGQPLQQSNPLGVSYIISNVNGTLINRFDTTTFNFRRRPNTIFEIDYVLADCYRALGPAEKFNLAVLSFKVLNEKNFAIFQNLNYLRLHIFQVLTFTLFVRPIRISNLIVDQEDKNIVVTFTLLDAPPRTGPVQYPLQESSLDTLVERLGSVIDSNALKFRAREGTKQITLIAIGKSLNVNYKTSETRSISTGPRITGLWVGFVFAGLFVGVVGGFFVFAKLSN